MIKLISNPKQCIKKDTFAELCFGLDIDLFDQDEVVALKDYYQRCIKHAD